LESGSKLRTLRLSAIAIASVVLVEIIIGAAANSLAIIGSGLHALFDVLSTLVLFLTVRESTKPADEEHMFGHEKFETIGGFVGGLALLIVALLLIYEAILKIMRAQSINFGLEYAGFAAIVYTLCIDFFRVKAFSETRNSPSPAMRVGFYDAVADTISTLVALAGFGLATLGFYYGDSISSMVLGILLTYLSVKLIWTSGMELTDTISKDVTEKVSHEILGTQGVCKLESLKIRKAGEKIFVNATVQVPDYLDFEEAHELTSKIESNIKKVVPACEIAIHTEPCKREISTEKLVENLALEVQGVKEVHEVNVSHTEGRLYVTLHANVDPNISVEAAHHIAQEIENSIEKRIPEVENVAVHMEPFRPRRRKGSTVNEEEIRRTARSIAENYRPALRVKGVVTYVAKKKLCINIDCSFAKEISLEKAHEIASQIENQIRERFTETIVTVHIEPD